MNTHQLQHTTIPLKDHQNRFILSFSPKTSFVSKIFRTFATLSAHYGFDSLIVGMSRWAGHYILKGVTDALLLAVRNFHNRNSKSRQVQM
jgi:hypothetical protein